MYVYHLLTTLSPHFDMYRFHYHALLIYLFIMFSTKQLRLKSSISTSTKTQTIASMLSYIIRYDDNVITANVKN